MDILIWIILGGAFTYVTVPLVLGITQDSRKSKELSKHEAKKRNPISDMSELKQNGKKELERVSEKVGAMSVNSKRNVTLDSEIIVKFDEKEDILLKGMLHENDGGVWKSEVIYLFQPRLIINGKTVKPRVKDGKLVDEVVYCVKDDQDKYVFYSPKREVSSGYEFDYVRGSSHGEKEIGSSLHIDLDFTPVDLSNPQEKAAYEAYRKERREDGLDDTDRYAVKVHNAKENETMIKIEKKYEIKNVETKEKGHHTDEESEMIKIMKRRQALTQRVNDLKSVGLLNEHDDHYDINSGTDPNSIGVNGVGRRS